MISLSHPFAALQFVKNLTAVYCYNYCVECRYGRHAKIKINLKGKIILQPKKKRKDIYVYNEIRIYSCAGQKNG